MSVNALLSTVILVSFIVTVVLAIGSYMAYKMRERGRTPAGRADVAGEPVFFERVYPGAPSPGGAAKVTQDLGPAA
jgi:hypothetical protein